MKSNSVMSWTLVGTVLTCTFKDGKRPLVVDFSKYSDAMKLNLGLHGTKQKIADAAAIAIVDGRPATVDEKRDAMFKIAENLANDIWSGPREVSVGGILLDALIIVYPKKTREQLVAYIKGKTPDERIALAKLPKVAKEIKELEALRVKSIDTKALEAEMDAA